MSPAAESTTEPRLTGPAPVAESWLGWLEQLFTPTPRRFQHCVGVWERALALRSLDIPWLDTAGRQALELAALVHDMGRGLDPANTEPHGFVGARLLDSMGLHRVACLVAHHSGARVEAERRGMVHLDVWADEDPDLLDVLTYLDRTTDVQGRPITLAGRRQALVERYGDDSMQVQAFDVSRVQLRRAEALLGAAAFRTPVG